MNNNGTFSLLIFALPLLLLGWLFFTQNKRMKQMRNFSSSLDVGDRVVTSSGIYGIDQASRRQQRLARDRRGHDHPRGPARHRDEAVRHGGHRRRTGGIGHRRAAAPTTHRARPRAPSRTVSEAFVARSSTKKSARRSLLALVVVILALGGLAAGLTKWGGGSMTPRLGLDLEGGTELVLQPQLTGTETISEGQVNRAVDIIRQRIDANGVSEAEITTQGGRSIVVVDPRAADGRAARRAEEALAAALPRRLRPGPRQQRHARSSRAARPPARPPSGTPSGTATGAATGTPKATGTATPYKSSSIHLLDKSYAGLLEVSLDRRRKFDTRLVILSMREDLMVQRSSIDGKASV